MGLHRLGGCPLPPTEAPLTHPTCSSTTLMPADMRASCFIPLLPHPRPRSCSTMATSWCTS